MAKKFDAKAKAKRQKIIAGVLGLVLLGALAWAVPSVLSSMNKKPPASSPVAAPPPPTATPPAPGAPPAAGTPVSATPPASGTLADSDPSPQAASGQLLSFDRFESKDPFAQQATTPATPPASSKTAPAPPPPPPPPPPPSGGAAKPTSAKISVNGATEPVTVGATFPSSDPVFRLVSLTKTSAKVAVAGGSLSTGSPTVTLTKGKKVTLMNTADGTRYELVLVSVT
jgi:hypothetical protein